MNNPWHQLNKRDESGSPEISAEATLAPESLWFDGHFPGAPILPGIAQLAMVRDMLRRHVAGTGGQIAIVAIKRVRFRQMIKPSDTIMLTAAREPDDPSAYKFRVTVQNQVACSGTMVTVPGER